MSLSGYQYATKTTMCMHVGVIGLYTSLVSITAKSGWLLSVGGKWDSLLWSCAALSPHSTPLFHEADTQLNMNPSGPCTELQLAAIAPQTWQVNNLMCLLPARCNTLDYSCNWSALNPMHQQMNVKSQGCIVTLQQTIENITISCACGTPANQF